MNQPSHRLLGQVFTPPGVAALMATLSIHQPDATVFDPCAGEGALLLAAGRRLAALGAMDWSRQLYGLEMAPETWARGRAELTAAAGEDAEPSHLFQGDFLALDPETRPLWGENAVAAKALAGRCFDVALMNPPYTRQELLPASWKRSVPGLSKRAGLYNHFWVHLARFVRQGGWLGAITPGTWLSAAFGGKLQAFLLSQFRIHFLITFSRDLFPDAQVEPCVAILEKCAEPDAAAVRAKTPVRFLRLDAPLDPARVDEAAGVTVCQGELSGESRWSRFFLAPSAGRCRVVSATAVPLSTLVQIRRGITTGNNRVYIPDAAVIARFGIEPECLRPLARSPREIPGLDTEDIAQPAQLLLPPEAKAPESGAAAYLRAMGAEAPAYGRNMPPPAPLLFGYAVRARKAFYRNSAALIGGDNFLCLQPLRDEDLAVLFALLNAAPTALLLEMMGRGQGRGLLKIQRYELAGLLVLDPARLDRGLRAELETLGEALRRDPTDTALRAALDQAAARAAGGEAEEIRRVEQDLRTARLARHEVTGDEFFLLSKPLSGA